MARMTYAEAARLALAEEMRRDPTVWALGEDLGPEGGVAGQYRGLQAEFGPRRIVDTPISESTIMGSSVGAAVAGTRPVVELRYCDFGLCAADEIVNQAAKIRYMTGGQARAPLAELSTKEWRRVMAVNLDGAFFTLRAAARHMTERAKAGDAGGRLVGMASSAAIHGAARAASYAATKGAMLTMIRALAVEMARYRVTANSILPGWVESDMTARAIGEHQRRLPGV